MKTTTPLSETRRRLEKALPSLPPADHYSMLGVRFSLRTDSHEVRDFFRAAYRHFATDRGAGPAPFPLVAILAEEAGGPLAAAGDALLDLAGRPLPVSRAFLFLLNSLMDQVSEFLVLHGAAVAIGGRGIILAGPPTAGKSTLVLELARRGAAFMSDDVAPLERSTGLLHAFPRAVGIRREGEAAARLDPAGLPAGSVHELPYKWLLDPAALGLRLPEPADAPCPVSAVLLLDAGEAERPGVRSRAGRSIEIALAEEDAGLLAELAATPGVSNLKPSERRPFPVFTFTVQPSSRPMSALAEMARRRRDLILYMDEARGPRPALPETPDLREARWSVLLMELARDLLNRSDTGRLMASCGGLPALIAELGRLLDGARAYRLRPGNPQATADLVLSLAAGEGGVEMKGAS